MSEKIQEAIQNLEKWAITTASIANNEKVNTCRICGSMWKDKSYHLKWCPVKVLKEELKDVTNRTIINS